MLYDVMKKALEDELEKIAGSMQGHVRGGRRPVSAQTLLDNEKETSKETKKTIAKLTKTGSKKEIAKTLAPDMKTLATLGIGAYGLSQLQKVKRRYNVGRQVEYQQQQGY